MAERARRSLGPPTGQEGPPTVEKLGDELVAFLHGMASFYPPRPGDASNAQQVRP